MELCLKAAGELLWLAGWNNDESCSWKYSVPWGLNGAIRQDYNEQVSESPPDWHADVQFGEQVAAVTLMLSEEDWFCSDSKSLENVHLSTVSSNNTLEDVMKLKIFRCKNWKVKIYDVNLWRFMHNTNILLKCLFNNTSADLN